MIHFLVFCLGPEKCFSRWRLPLNVGGAVVRTFCLSSSLFVFKSLSLYFCLSLFVYKSLLLYFCLSLSLSSSAHFSRAVASP